MRMRIMNTATCDDNRLLSPRNDLRYRFDFNRIGVYPACAPDFFVEEGDRPVIGFGLHILAETAKSVQA